MSLRVVLYAEGTGDTGGEFPTPRLNPGDQLVDEFLGPAHVLVRRSIVRARPNLPSEAILFGEPLRPRGRSARGSDLVHAPTLRKLLTWLTGNRPNLAVVLVDRDGVQERRSALLEAIRELSVPMTRVIGVAVEEFESWLIGDPDALARVLPGVTSPPEIETLDPRRAKSLLQQWSAHQPDKTERQIRLSLANILSLEMLERRCPSFARFSTDLSAALPQ